MKALGLWENYQFERNLSLFFKTGGLEITRIAENSKMIVILILLVAPCHDCIFISNEEG